MDKKIPMPVIISAIAIVVLIAGYFIFNSITGGKVEQGEAGRVEAAPPAPKSGGVSGQPGAPPRQTMNSFAK